MAMAQKNNWLAAGFVLVMLTAPFGAIWSLNTLFGLGIAYTFKTWLAMFALACFSGIYKIESK